MHLKYKYPVTLKIMPHSKSLFLLIVFASWSQGTGFLDDFCPAHFGKCMKRCLGEESTVIIKHPAVIKRSDSESQSYEADRWADLHTLINMCPSFSSAWIAPMKRPIQSSLSREGIGKWWTWTWITEEDEVWAWFALTRSLRINKETSSAEASPVKASLSTVSAVGAGSQSGWTEWLRVVVICVSDKSCWW